MDDQTKRLRGGAVEVCPECDIAGCRHIRARAALAAQHAASAKPVDNGVHCTGHVDHDQNSKTAKKADRQSVAWGTSVSDRVDRGGRRVIENKKNDEYHTN